MLNVLEGLKDACNLLDKGDVRVPAVKGTKIATTTASVKLAVGKLLTASTKMALVENRRDVSVRKIWI